MKSYKKNLDRVGVFEMQVKTPPFPRLWVFRQNPLPPQQVKAKHGEQVYEIVFIILD